MSIISGFQRSRDFLLEASQHEGATPSACVAAPAVACIREEIKLQEGDEQANADTLAQLEAADDSDSDGGFF